LNFEEFKALRKERKAALATRIENDPKFADFNTIAVNDVLSFDEWTASLTDPDLVELKKQFDKADANTDE